MCPSFAKTLQFLYEIWSLYLKKWVSYAQFSSGCNSATLPCLGQRYLYRALYFTPAENTCKIKNVQETIKNAYFPFFAIFVIFALFVFSSFFPFLCFLFVSVFAFFVFYFFSIFALFVFFYFCTLVPQFSFKILSVYLKNGWLMSTFVIFVLMYICNFFR